MSVADVNSNAPNPNPGVGPPDNQKPDSPKGGHDRAKDDKKQANPKPMDPNNPTVASTDNSKSILDAIKQVDPGNVAGFIKKALDAMMMIRSIDGASGTGGGAGAGLAGGGSSGATTAAAIGRGLINTAQLLNAAQQLGLKRVLDSLNSIMPALIPLLDDDTINILDQAILAIITDVDVGVLSPLSVQAATATAAAISTVQGLSSLSTPTELVAGALTAATIGGSSLNLDPNSLAALILAAAIGSTITNTLQLNNKFVVVNVIINSNYISTQLANIPSFTGTESQTIATTQAAVITNQLVPLIQSNTLTAAAFLAILQGAQQNIQSAGLKQALGTDINGILSQITQLISQFSGNIMDSEQDHQPRARLTTVTQALQNHSKILSLIKKKLDIADIFQSMGGGGAGQSMSAISGAMGSISSALSGSGIAQALSSSDIIPSTGSVSNTLQSLLQSGQNPLTSLSTSALATLTASGGAMLNSLTGTQVQSLLQALPPNLVMSLIGGTTAMFSNLTTQEINLLLAQLPQNTVTQLLQGNQFLTNFHSSGASLAEQTSDIAGALASVISTQVVGTILTAILPNGTTVICNVIA